MTSVFVGKGTDSAFGIGKTSTVVEGRKRPNFVSMRSQSLRTPSSLRIEIAGGN